MPTYLVNSFFFPVAIETLGPFGDSAHAFISELGRRLVKVTGNRKATSELRQQLSIAVQRGNAIAVRGSLA